MKAKCRREELTDMNKTYALKILTNYYQEISTVTKVTSATILSSLKFIYICMHVGTGRIQK